MKKSSSIQLKLTQKINLDGKTYSVIGIDRYRLTNVLGKLKTWVSYTLIDNKNRKAWISYGTAGKYFTQWIPLSESAFKKHAAFSFILDLSGIASITFEGNQGFSLPNAETVWFYSTNNSYDYISIERFLDLEKNHVTPTQPYYLAGKILKNFQP